MKKITVFCLFLAFIVSCTIGAVAQSVDISGLDAEQLLELRETVNLRLRELGAYPYLEISKNEKSDEVLNLQKRLIELNYFTGEPSGKYDDATVKAYKAFEKASGMKQNGVASIEEQTLLFSDDAVAKPTPTPKPTPKPTPTPDPRKAYGSFNFTDVSRYPEKHMDEMVKITGTVVQVLGTRTSGYELRVATKGRYDNIVYILLFDDPGFGILEDDKITAYCTVDEPITYETVMGASITLPGLLCDMIELRK